MEPTLEELLRLAELIDPDDFVDRLGLTTSDLVLAFSKEVRDNPDLFYEEIERTKLIQ